MGAGAVAETRAFPAGRPVLNSGAHGGYATSAQFASVIHVFAPSLSICLEPKGCVCSAHVFSSAPHLVSLLLCVLAPVLCLATALNTSIPLPPIASFKPVSNLLCLKPMPSRRPRQAPHPKGCVQLQHALFLNSDLFMPLCHKMFSLQSVWPCAVPGPCWYQATPFLSLPCTNGSRYPKLIYPELIRTRA